MKTPGKVFLLIVHIIGLPQGIIAVDVHPPQEYAYLRPFFVIGGALVIIVCVYNIYNLIKNWKNYKSKLFQ